MTKLFKPTVKSSDAQDGNVEWLNVGSEEFRVKYSEKLKSNNLNLSTSDMLLFSNLINQINESINAEFKND